MKLITSTTELSKEFKRLLNTYQQYSWLTAWAGKPFELTNILANNTNRIQKIVVGLHFYQTHPDFIEKFIDNKFIRFIKQTEGTFHSKLYLFENSSNDWELLIGSNNFTNMAFSSNTETAILVNTNSPNANNILSNAKRQIDISWNISKSFSTNELNEYKTVFLNQQRKINSLSSSYGNNQTITKPIFKVPITTMSWDTYAEKVLNDQYHSVDERLRILDGSRGFFNSYPHFKDMPVIVRKAIAGTYNGLNDNNDWLFFGSMKGAGRFKQRIGDNDNNISLALDQIPLSGQITRLHFDEYMRYFLKQSDIQPIATATRLLALKRPDIFLCFDNKNRKNLCETFEIRNAGMTLDRYWDEIIERIFDSEWWVNPKPRNEIEQRVRNNRSAMLDSLFYEKD